MPALSPLLISISVSSAHLYFCLISSSLFLASACTASSAFYFRCSISGFRMHSLNFGASVISAEQGPTRQWTRHDCTSNTRQSASLGKQRSEQSRVGEKGPSRYESWIRDQESKGVRRAKGPLRIKENGGASLFLHQILILHPHISHLYLHSCTLAALFTHTIQSQALILTYTIPVPNTTPCNTHIS